MIHSMSFLTTPVKTMKVRVFENVMENGQVLSTSQLKKTDE